ncbi:MAG: RNA polymerase sigma factor, partial [Gemmatimonadaceae bacterium]
TPMKEERDPPDDSTLDQTLIARWREGDERAASQLVERHAQPVARYLQSLGAREAVEELVQDTFVRAFSSLDSFRGDSSLRTWLFTIARRLLLDSRRAFKRRRDVEPIQEGDAVTEYDALDGMIAGESGQRVLDAVERLSPTQREVFALRAGEGRSYREIAEIVGTTEGAARVHYHNALRTVKEKLYV